MIFADRHSFAPVTLQPEVSSQLQSKDTLPSKDASCFSQVNWPSPTCVVQKIKWFSVLDCTSCWDAVFNVANLSPVRTNNLIKKNVPRIEPVIINISELLIVYAQLPAQRAMY